MGRLIMKVIILDCRDLTCNKLCHSYCGYITGGIAVDKVTTYPLAFFGMEETWLFSSFLLNFPMPFPGTVLLS